MCLSYNKEATERLRLRIADKSEAFVKVYSVDADRSISSPMQKTRVLISDNGEVVSNRESLSLSDFEASSNTVDKGIHVYNERRIIATDMRVIKVKANVNADDLIGCDDQGLHAVFMKIQVDKEEVEKAIDEELKRRTAKGEPQSNLAYAAWLQKQEDEEDYEEDDDDEDEDYDRCDYCGSRYCDGECEDDDDEEDEDEDDGCDECGDPDCCGECLDDDDDDWEEDDEEDFEDDE